MIRNDVDTRSRKESQQYAATWFDVLIKQHHQLIQDIESISDFLSQPAIAPLLLDAKIKRLIKGVKVHLELENTFLSPALENIEASKAQKEQLKGGYDSLQSTCEKTMELARLLVLYPDKETFKDTYIPQVKLLLEALSSRLEEEDATYSLLELSEQNHV